MSDIKRDTDKTLSVGKLSLKRPSVEQGVVRQSFSHGRSKAVVVETKKRRVLKPGDGKEAEAAAPRPRAEARAEPERVETQGAAAPAWCCARSRTRRSPRASRRSRTPASARPRSAAAPRRRPGSGPRRRR